MEYYNKYIKYKKKYYNLKYGGSKKNDKKKFDIKNFKKNFIKQLQNCSKYLKNCDNYGLGKNFSENDIFILEISYDESKKKLEFISATDNIEANENIYIYVPIYINKKFIEHYLLDNKEIKLEPPEQKIYRPPRIKERLSPKKHRPPRIEERLSPKKHRPPRIKESLSPKKYRDYKKYKDYIIEYYNNSDGNIMIPIKFKEIGISEIHKSYAHNKPGYKYVFLPKNIIEEYYKNNIQFLKSEEEETDIINDIFYMTDGRQYIYKEFEAKKKEEKEKEKKENKKYISSLMNKKKNSKEKKISKELLHSIIYLDDGVNYDDNHKQYLINYNAPDNLKENFAKVFSERGKYLNKIKNSDYELSDKIKPILIKIGFDVNKIEKLINQELNKLINLYDYQDNISSLFNIKYEECKGNVPLSDYELEVDEKLILFNKIYNLKDDLYKIVNERFKSLVDNSTYTYNATNNSIRIYFKLFGKKYNETLKKLKNIEDKDKDLRTLILNQKELLQELFNHNVIFFGSLDLLRYIRGNIIIRLLYYLLNSIEGSNSIPLLRWDLIMNKYIFACRLNNMKRFFFIFKKEQKLSVKPENRAFKYDKERHIFLDNIEYNKKDLWVFLDKKKQNLILVDRTSSIVYLNNSNIPTNVLYTELKMLLWRKDFTNKDFKFFHILDDNKHHDTIFCINKNTLDEEYIYENAEPKPILDKSVDVKSKPILAKSGDVKFKSMLVNPNPISAKGGMNKSESKHKIIINKDNFIINGITVREVELRMDTDGRTIGFFNLQSK